MSSFLGGGAHGGGSSSEGEGDEGVGADGRGEAQEEEHRLPPLDPEIEIAVPEEAVAQLTAMGFSENAARKALVITGRPEAAMEWILEHVDDVRSFSISLVRFLADSFKTG